jgi:hypothetical protein
MGTGYGCIDVTGTTIPCVPAGNIGIRYKSPRAAEGKYAYYKFDGTAIYECLEREATDNCGAATTDFEPITSGEVKITKAVFYVLGTGDPLKQPRMIFTLSGEAGTKDRIATTFDLQTTVSQRTRNEI